MERNRGLDLIRIYTMFCVCLLHMLGQAGLLDYCISGSLNEKVFWAIEILAYPAVDIFALLSGYVSSDKPVKYDKLVLMWLQVFFYSFVLTLGLSLFMNFKMSYRYGLPVTFDIFWYFTGYFVLTLLRPLFDKALFSLSSNQAKKLLIVLLVLFTVPTLINDPFIINRGYSTVWIIIMYFIGALLKVSEITDNISTKLLLVISLLSYGTTVVLKVFLGIDRIVSYPSPTIMVSAITTLIIFSRVDTRLKLEKISPIVFGVYLFQLSPVIWNNVLANMFVKYATSPVYIGLALAIIGAIILFIIGLSVDYLRSLLFKLLKFDKLTKTIVTLTDKLLTTTINLLNPGENL